MTSRNELKINKLLKVAPKNAVLTTTWLQERGIPNKLAWWYVKSGWFERIAGGAYCFAGNNMSWAGAISAVQQQLKLPVYPGGKTFVAVFSRTFSTFLGFGNRFKPC